MKCIRFKKEFIVGILCFFCLLSCSEKKEYKLGKEKLTLIIRDMNLVELLTENKSVVIKDSVRQLNLNRMCSIHHVNILDVKHDLEMLSTDFLLLDSIYGQIILMDTTTKVNTDLNSPPK